MMSLSRRFGLALALAMVAHAGCGGPPDQPAVSEEATVRGVVTIDGKKAAAGKIVFQAQGREPVKVDVQPDGAYSLTTQAGTNFISVEGAALEKAAATRPPQVPCTLEPGENILDLAY